jgi:hypothetical protein
MQVKNTFSFYYVYGSVHSYFFSLSLSLYIYIYIIYTYIYIKLQDNKQELIAKYRIEHSEFIESIDFDQLQQGDK